MNSVEIMISTVHPDYNRTLLQYTAEDMEAEIEKKKKMDSDKQKLLEGVDVAGYEL